MSRSTSILTVLVLAFSTTVAYSAKHKPIVAGDLVVNPSDVIAVYRAAEQQGVVVFIGRPGQDLQTIAFRDSREASAMFNDLWGNNEVVKDPGDDDARPLTRMRLKEAERKPATLIVNVDRLLAMVRDPDRRVLHVYLDRPSSLNPLLDPNTREERPFLEIHNNHDEADNILAAYKACVYTK